MKVALITPRSLPERMRLTRFSPVNRSTEHPGLGAHWFKKLNLFGVSYSNIMLNAIAKEWQGLDLEYSLKGDFFLLSHCIQSLGLTQISGLSLDRQTG